MQRIATRTGALALLLLVTLRPADVSAETSTLSAVIPFQGQGQAYPVGVGKLRFIGVIEGIMYIESAQGQLDEAFVQCPITQLIDAAEDSITTQGECNIIVSPQDTVFAEITCEGINGLCTGYLTLTGGTGMYENIRGSGAMTARSPVQALVADLSSGMELQVAAGIIQVPVLSVTLP